MCLVCRTKGASVPASTFGGTNKVHAKCNPVPGVTKSLTDRKPLEGPNTVPKNKLHNKAHVTCNAAQDVLKSS